MRLANAPQPVLAKLLSLDEHAKQLTEQAERHARRIADLRDRLDGRKVNSRDDYVALEQELPRLIAEQPKLQARVRAEQTVLSACKVFIDRLPGGSELDAVEVEPTGDLAAVRAQIAKLGEERRAIINAAPSPQEMASEVKRWVATVGEAGKPSRLLTDNSFSPRWGGSANTDPSDRPRSVLAFMAWCDPDAMAARFQAELQAQATEISKLSRDERRERLDEIEAALLTARYQEEALVAAAIQNGADVTRDTDTKPEAVLQVRLRREASSSSAASTRSSTARTSMHPGPGSSAPATV